MTFIVTFTAVVVATLFAVSTAQNQCQLLTDPSAPVWNSVIGQHVPGGKEAAIEKVKTLHLDDNFSSCLASTSISVFDALNIFTSSKCNAAIKAVLPNFNPPGSNDMTLAPTYKEISDQFVKFKEVTPATLVDTVREFRAWAYGFSPEKSNEVCDNVNGNVDPCLETVLVPILFKKIFDNDCCSAFKSDWVSKYVGKELNFEWVNQAVRTFANVPCTKQTPGFSSPTQSCQYTFVRSVLNDQYVDHLKALLSIPDSEVCSVADGKEFKTTSGGAHKFANGFGCCVKTVETAMEFVKDFPIVKMYLPSDATTNGKCVNAADIPIVKQFLPKVPSELKPIVDSFFKDLCVHVPVGVSNSCNLNNGGTCTSL